MVRFNKCDKVRVVIRIVVFYQNAFILKPYDRDVIAVVVGERANSESK